MNATSLLGRGAERLAAVGIPSPRLDAEVLLAHVHGMTRTALYARLTDPVDAATAARFAALLERRAQREPIAYLTGVQEFWSLPFAVTPDVLIPRPETELLVEVACRICRPPRGAAATVPSVDRHRPAPAPTERRPPDVVRELAILDLGTGSGCIAVAIARELPRARVVAVDASPGALAVARQNALRHGVAERVSVRRGDLFAALDDATSFDLVVSNPPYLAPGDAASPELAFEPRAALCGGADGLAVIRRIVAAAPEHLRRGGALLMEIGLGQAAAVVELARAAGLAAIRVEADLAGIPRVLVAERP